MCDMEFLDRIIVLKKKNPKAYKDYLKELEAVHYDIELMKARNMIKIGKR